MAGDALVATVTDIVAPRRGSKRRIIHLDGAEWRTTSSEVITELDVRIGARVEPSALESALGVAEPARARERALRLLAYHDRSAAELTGRLTEDGYAESVAHGATGRLRDIGLVDDARFAEMTARVLTQTRGHGRARALRDLEAKGIDPDVALAAVDEALPVGEETDAAAALASRFARRPGATVDRVVARLARKGYGVATALRAARRAFEDLGADDAMSGRDQDPDCAADLHE